MSLSDETPRSAGLLDKAMFNAAWLAGTLLSLTIVYHAWPNLSTGGGLLIGAGIGGAVYQGLMGLAGSIRN